jgi:peptidoglycan hydrolase CwlO-like protein
MATLSLSLAFQTYNTYSASAESLSEIKQKQEQNKSEQSKKENELNHNHGQQDQTLQQIEALQSSIEKTAQDIKGKQQSIDRTKANIEQLKKEIGVLEKRIAERDKLLKERVTSMYESGGAVSYLDVLLGSKDFGDFIDRVFALNVIAEQDKTILEEHKKDKMAVEDKKGKVESELISLNQDLKELEGLNQQLSSQKKQKDTLLASLKEEESHIENDMMNLQEQNELLAAQEATIKAEIARAKREEEERKKREAAQAAAAAAAAAKAKAEAAAREKSSNSGSSSAPAPTPEPAPAPSHSGHRDFITPTQGVVTSGFGMRSSGMHEGIDISKHGGNVPVVAAASGTVSRSYKSSSYGNVVFLSSYIDGQLYTTVYAHMRMRNVSSGQTVSQGQLLGYQGNTGHSFGQHLHFELHRGEWNMAKSNAINPRPYIY